ncbi:hypothetical protein [Hymenobacter volaticus]|uniref:Uncharacterized protein n=1 Tax=Hymenobacter volaticus TaxID=2932254 RepID=A0ABY4GE47_9BACT|nr:hypothetical protein [Hymenobacter volaticus]UOQ69149.1 hypothetical protein MUN86_25885 [Hymenobacter volaticus]
MGPVTFLERGWVLQKYLLVSYSYQGMRGHKHFSDKVITQFRLSERVPHHNLYRRLRELLNWDVLSQQTRAVYSHGGWNVNEAPPRLPS